jgi:hypothetical protein
MEELTMSTSLLLALLGTHEDGESDHTRELFEWIGARPDATQPNGWTSGQPERAELVMRTLYDLLRSTIYPSTPDNIGTVLARTLTDDTDPDGKGYDLQHFARPLRQSLREKMLKYLDDLRSQYPSAIVPASPASGSTGQVAS